jgi:seryl-tRNA synthetase
MLDIKFIRENPKQVKDSCKKRGIVCDINNLLKTDEKKRKTQTELENISAQKNKASKEIGKKNLPAGEKKKVISEMKKIDKKGDKLKQELKKLTQELKELIYQVPNILADDVPEGKDERDNKVIRKWGEIPKFDFQPKDHVELGEQLDIIDIKNAAKISGTRFGYLKKQAALLEFALIHYVFDVLTDSEVIREIAGKYSDKVFIPVVPPVMIKPDVYEKMARLNEEDKDERYYLTKDDIYLIGSAEHTLGPLHMDEIIEEKNLPLRYVGFSTCFRREAGSYGKDTKGILRVHQFDKIEIESFTIKEDAPKEQEFIIALQEFLVQSLKIPYQVVILCSGDMGRPDARQVDIECWLPGQNKYRETHTSDLMTDYQARRLNTRVRRGEKIEFAHMNDATVFAIGRILIAIIENYQQKDGSIKIPEVLQKYTGFKEIK